jgi:hypothetical protein
VTKKRPRVLSSNIPDVGSCRVLTIALNGGRGA